MDKHTTSTDYRIMNADRGALYLQVEVREDCQRNEPQARNGLNERDLQAMHILAGFLKLTLSAHAHEALTLLK